MKSARVRRNHDFLLIRKVVSIERHSSSDVQVNCFKFVTEDLHPLELFRKFEIHSLIDKPTYTSFIPIKENVTDPFINSTSPKKGKESLQGVPGPTADGLTSCLDYGLYPTNNLFLNADRYTDGKSYAISKFLSKGRACAEYATNFGGGFNFNYDPNAQKASTADLQISQGVTCKDCYAFAGATFYAHIEYVTDLLYLTGNFGLEVSLKGNSGANVDLQLTNPSVSGLLKLKILDGQKDYFKIPIYTGALYPFYI